MALLRAPEIVAPRHVHLDAIGGMAGDMFVAAMLAALPNLRDRVLADVGAVLPTEVGAARLETGMSGGLAVLRFRLDEGAAAGSHHHHDHSHDHGHGDGHVHDHDHGHDHGDAPRPVTRFPDLCRRIAAAPLAAGTAERAIDILTELASAEAEVHGVAIDDVHFHEVADWDSLMDVVAAGSIAAALPEVCWTVSDLPRGGGLVKTAHGLLPVPAPATAVLLSGFRLRDDGVGGERVTPTGAAILAALVGDVTASAAGRVVATGLGAGTRTLPGMPNIVRALVFADDGRSVDGVEVIAFDVDDMTGEEIGVAAERLRATDGVIDLSIGQRQGKKGRPVSDFRLLVRPDRRDAVAAACFAETSTIGLRHRREERTVLTRRPETVDVDGQPMRRKRAFRPGGTTTVKAESDDVAARPGDLATRRALRRRAEQEQE